MIRRAVRLFFALFVISSCKPGFKGEDSIAEVNGQHITLDDYNKVRDQFKPGESSETKDSFLSVRNTIIKYLVRRTVLLSEAKKRGLHISDDELAERVATLKLNEATNATEEILLEKKLTDQNWKENLRDDFLIEKLLEDVSPKFPKPSLRQLLAAYEKQANRFRQPATADAVIVVVPSEEAAQNLRTKWMGKRAAFLEYLKSSGLEVNLETQTIYEGSLEAALDSALFKMRPGSISPPLPIASGFAVVQVLKVKPSLNLSFDQVKSQLQDELLAEARRHFLENQQESWIREATIRYNRSLIAGL